MNRILMTGGNGHLGTELRKYLKGEIIAPTRKEFDITDITTVYPDIDMIINCAAYVDVEGAELNKETCFKINTLGTYNLLQAYKGIPFVQISTEYANNPTNFYGRTKLEAERMVQELSWKHLIIRTLFKPRPFPHEKAFNDQYTMGSYLDEIAPMIVSEILIWGKDKVGQTVHVGYGGRKTIYELAQETNPNVKPCSVNDISGVRLPKDYK